MCFLSTDDLVRNSINQTDIHERGYQVTQMRKIYQKAKAVLIWVGPDSDDHQAKVAIDSIITISDFLCEKLGIPVSDLYSVENLYQKIMATARDVLPVAKRMRLQYRRHVEVPSLVLQASLLHSGMGYPRS
jgi:hypothetical protein